MLKKTAIWDRAYIVNTEKHGKVVIVPLEYDKHLSTNLYSPDQENISLQKLSHLFIYKDEEGFQIEVVFVFPDKQYLENRASAFSGIVLVEDWAGNSIHNYRYKDGNVYSLVKQNSGSSGGRVDEYTCVHINWYQCSVDEGGGYYDCIYLYTENLGCGDYQSLNPDGGGGGDYTVDDVEYLAWATTTIQVFNHVWSSNAYDNVSVMTTQKLFAKLHNQHPEKDWIRECDFIKSDVTGQTHGGTSAIGTYTVTGTGTTNISVRIAGNLNFPDNTYFPFDHTSAISINDIAWQH